MRRNIAIIALTILIISLFSGCHRLVDAEKESISVYASFWPVYALTDAVMADTPDASLHALVQPQDGCLRDYQLSDWDLALLAHGADAVIIGGRGLESFESALFSWGDSGPAISAVLYNLPMYNQDQKAAGESESHLTGANPHLYLSLEGAQQIVESVSASLQSLDPAYSESYVKNAQAAVARLRTQLTENRALLAGCVGRKVILMNEALIYVAQDYGLEVADWIDRESCEAMMGNDIEACLKRLEAVDCRVILIEKQAPQAMTEALEAAGYTLAKLDVLSTHREGEGFDAYIEAQAANAQAISDAFERTNAGEG